MRVAFFEDESAAQLHPIALLRPVFELLCGHFPLRERIIRSLEVTEWGGHCGFLMDFRLRSWIDGRLVELFTI